MEKGARFTGGIPSLWFLVRYRRASIRGKSDSCHESNLNTAGPRAFKPTLHMFMIIPMFHKSDFGVPLVSLLPCPFFVDLGVGSPWGSPLTLSCLCWGGHLIPCLFFVAGCVCGPSQKM